MTRHTFNDDYVTCDIDAVINVNEIVNDDDIDRLSSVMVISDSIAYVIFTSGSTGNPKAVSF